ncbi:NUDIX hydrolase [Butyricicoccus sp.]|uniref:NUDIX hydrolase n=1 Tax=Butyricicoccus sp. TaxID=2049021 RepID=UPI003F1756C1
MEEQLDIFDEQMNCIGTAPRSRVHAEGLLHQVVHCWIIGESEPVLYFQQRAHTKADFPDSYDLACGGHIGAGEYPDTAVLREVWEETGLHLMPGQLAKLGQYRAPDLKIPGFFDRETSNVYVLRQDTPSFASGEEVARMICVDAEEFCRMELENAQEIEAKTLDGEVFRISRDEWCCHDGEFAALVFPYLKQVFPQLRCTGD